MSTREQRDRATLRLQELAEIYFLRPLSESERRDREAAKSILASSSPRQDADAPEPTAENIWIFRTADEGDGSISVGAGTLRELFDADPLTRGAFTVEWPKSSPASWLDGESFCESYPHLNPSVSPPVEDADGTGKEGGEGLPAGAHDHGPLPWTLREGQYVLRDAEGGLVLSACLPSGYTTMKEAEPRLFGNLTLAALAVNSHASLVAEAEALRAQNDGRMRAIEMLVALCEAQGAMLNLIGDNANGKPPVRDEDVDAFNAHLDAAIAVGDVIEKSLNLSGVPVSVRDDSPSVRPSPDAAPEAGDGDDEVAPTNIQIARIDERAPFTNTVGFWWGYEVSADGVEPFVVWLNNPRTTTDPFEGTETDWARDCLADGSNTEHGPIHPDWYYDQLREVVRYDSTRADA